MQYRSRARAAPRLSLIPILFMTMLALLAAGAIFVGFRMLFAPRPQVSLEAPFDLVGRNAPLIVNVKDRAGLKRLRATVAQGGGEQVVVAESYHPPRKEDQVKWAPPHDPRIRLEEEHRPLTVPP